ncbi:hypothetical protein BKA70DRAFT_1307753 [Coprinopsis sp. MPI-PUGE-AT-0042]|nr:hypothetical protein BKA70DRAFT_1307753 [Coprinopsis sp. MPI-PUGE-AT-0042]
MASVTFTTAQEQVLQGLIAADILPIVFGNLEDIVFSELEDIVFGNSEDGERERQGDPNLRSAALVCKAFSKPALDVLWRTMDSLDPLLPFVIPPETSVLMSKNHAKRSRFESYRNRIHRIRIFHGFQPQETSSVREASLKAVLHMCHLLRREELLPNLKELSIHGIESANTDTLIPFLLTPSLRSISLGGCTPPPSQLFPLVSSLSPATEALELGVGYDPLSVDAAGSRGTIPLEYLSDLKELRSLSVNSSWEGRWSLKVSSIHNLLRQLPKLTNLSLMVNHIEHDWYLSMHNDPIVAPLELFSLIYSPNPSTGLQSFHSLPFVTKLIFVVDPLIEIAQEVASFLCDVAFHPKLNFFSMSGATRANLPTLGLDAMLPLISSRTLKWIVLDVLILSHSTDDTAQTNPPPSTVVDSIINVLKQHHGQLEQLHLPDIISPMPPFHTLMGFAQHVPWLKGLSLGVCIPSGIATELQVLSQVRFKNSLQNLTVVKNSHPLSVDNYPLLAQCIDSWFPNLDELSFYQDDDSLLPRINELRSEFKRTRLSEQLG